MKPLVPSSSVGFLGSDIEGSLGDLSVHRQLCPTCITLLLNDQCNSHNPRKLHHNPMHITIEVPKNALQHTTAVAIFLTWFHPLVQLGLPVVLVFPPVKKTPNSSCLRPWSHLLDKSTLGFEHHKNFSDWQCTEACQISRAARSRTPPPPVAVAAVGPADQHGLLHDVVTAGQD